MCVYTQKLLFIFFHELICQHWHQLNVIKQWLHFLGHVCPDTVNKSGCSSGGDDERPRHSTGRPNCPSAGNEPVEQKPSQVQAPPTPRSHWLLESALQVFPDSFPLNADVERPAADVGSTSGCGSVAKPEKKRPTEDCLPCPASALPRFYYLLI